MNISNEIISIQDKDYHVNLSDLANVNCSSSFNLNFQPLSSFILSKILFQGDTATIFRGTCEGQTCIIETCNRIPYRLVCREIQYLTTDLGHLENIVKITSYTKNTSLGVVALAYENFDFIPWTTQIPIEYLIPLFATLLATLSKLHHRKYSHGCICRSSIFVSPDFKSMKLGCFHAAVKTNDIVAFTYNHPCSPKGNSVPDARRADLYSAALWFLSYFDEDPHNALEHLETLPIPTEIKEVLLRLTTDEEAERLSGDKASKAILAYLSAI